MNLMITDLMSVRGAIRSRSIGGVDAQRFELERVDDSLVVLSLDLTDALSLVGLIVEQVGAAVSPGHSVVTAEGPVSLGTQCLRCRHAYNWHANANSWCAVVVDGQQCGCHFIAPTAEGIAEGDQSKGSSTGGVS